MLALWRGGNLKAHGTGKVVAVIGASMNPAKYGHRSVRAHVRQGYTTYAVNPNLEGTIEGATTVARLEDIPVKIDRVTLYLPPELGIKLLPSIKAAAPDEFWVNPGAEDDDFIEKAEAAGLDPIYACSILDIGERP